MMHEAKTYLLGTAVLAMLVMTGTMTDSGWVFAQSTKSPTPVQIASPIPVPVSGSVSVSGTPTVTVGNTGAQPVPVSGSVGLVSGTTVSISSGSVSVLGTPTVTVGNTSVQPVPTKDQGTELRPVNIPLPPISVAPGEESNAVQGIYFVPAGFRLIIDYIAFYGVFLNGESAVAIEVVAVGGSNGSITSYAVAPASNLPAFLDGPNTVFHPVVVSQKVFMFGNPGDSISVLVMTDGGSGGANFGSISVNGHLVAVP